MPEDFTNRTITQIPISVAAATTDIVAAPGAGLKVYVVGINLTVDTASTTIQFTEGTGPTNLTGAMEFPDGGGMIVNGGETVVLQTNVANSKLTLVTATGGAKGWIRYFVAP
jgi:hypothetical protein